MPDAAHEGILNRSEAAGHAAQHYAPQLALLEQVVNYGTNLIRRAYESSEHDLSSAVTCGVLLRQVVAMFDAIHVLAVAGATHAAYLPVRAAFEASIYLDWMLFSDSDHKARCYLVGNYRKERSWAKAGISGTAERAMLDDASTKSGFPITPPSSGLTAAGTTLIAEIDRLLAQPAMALIDADYVAYRGRRHHDVEWYQLCGANSVRDIAEKVKRLMEYTIYYAKGSAVSHTGSYKDHIRVGKDIISIRQIRDVTNMRDVVMFVVVTALRSYQSVILRYRNEEMPALRRKYTEEWRAPFLSVPSAKYQPS